MQRKVILANDELYHVYNKSIYGYLIFNNDKEFERMLAMMYFYQWQHEHTFCRFLPFDSKKYDIWTEMSLFKQRYKPIVEIKAYCLMPTHVHLILKQKESNGISVFMKKILGGYTLYFNYRHHRRGPLWQSRFGSRLIKDDADMHATTLYVHENPVKDLNLLSPGNWIYSSYLEIHEKKDLRRRICIFT